ncbi:murein L,D-transpeptidase [Bacillus mycoides]|nr:murein L,D-transpeptidase [Bacillus mycoides]QWI50274.1 murein L,D-transpeptidase [Bacillus mycoides]
MDIFPFLKGNKLCIATGKGGSRGCVNLPSSIVNTVYNNLSTYEPVIVY